MIYTDEQFKELSEFEDNFFTAVNARYSRYIPKAKMERILAIYCEALNIERTIDFTCPQCVVGLLQKVGKMYYADKDERANGKEQTSKTASEKTATEGSASRKSKGQRSKTKK